MCYFPTLLLKSSYKYVFAVSVYVFQSRGNGWDTFRLVVGNTDAELLSSNSQWIKATLQNEMLSAKVWLEQNTHYCLFCSWGPLSTPPPHAASLFQRFEQMWQRLLPMHWCTCSKNKMQEVAHAGALKAARSPGWTAACVVSPEAVFTWIVTLVNIDLLPFILIWQFFLHEVDEKVRDLTCRRQNSGQFGLKVTREAEAPSRDDGNAQA